MIKKTGPGRPKKNPEAKRSKAFLLRLKPCEYEQINKKFQQVQKNDPTKVESLTDYIIKSASGDI